MAPARPLAVHAWPGALPAPLHGALAGVIVIKLATDGERASARAQVRLGLRQMLGELLALAPDQIVLESTPGQAPRLILNRERAVGLSISHAAGLSLAAINLHGPVGVDLIAVPAVTGSLDELGAVARDYLGPIHAVALAGVAPHLRRMAFAKAWAAHEASLKCQGLGLAEWRPGPPAAALRSVELELPEPFIGVLATPV